jgi:hypothetical protein
MKTPKYSVVMDSLSQAEMDTIFVFFWDFYSGSVVYLGGKMDLAGFDLKMPST